MSDTVKTILIIAAIVLVLLAIFALVLKSMREKSREADRAKAGELRDSANVQASGLPDARARAEQAEVEAERARQEAARAEERANAAKTGVAHEEAAQEDRIRAADRLDPDVDHTADDYAPEVAAPAGPANVPGDQPYADSAPASSDAGRDQSYAPRQESAADNRQDPQTILDSDEGASPETSAGQRTSTDEPVDTAPRDHTRSSSNLQDRLASSDSSAAQAPTTDQQAPSQQAQQAQAATGDGDTPPDLPRRVRGAQQMPGGQQASSEWDDNWFKRKDPPQS